MGQAVGKELRSRTQEKGAPDQEKVLSLELAAGVNIRGKQMAVLIEGIRGEIVILSFESKEATGMFPPLLLNLLILRV